MLYLLIPHSSPAFNKGAAHREIVLGTLPGCTTLNGAHVMYMIYLVGMAIFFFLVLSNLTNRAAKTRGGQAVKKIVRSTFEGVNISWYEVIGVTSCFFGVIAVIAVAAASFDDYLDSVLLGVAALVGLTIALLVTSLHSFLLYCLSPASRGEAVRALYVADIQNTLLGFARVALCWTRYVFYDAQVEIVDMALQHNDELFSSTAEAPEAWSLLSVLDVLAMGVQILMSLFKIAIASFLLWLIIDLFLLRPLTRVLVVWKTPRL